MSYDFFFVTGQLYIDRKAPRHLRASAQGFFNLLTYGAGMLIGNYVLGWWGDSIQLDGSTTEGWLAGATSFWVMPAIFALDFLGVLDVGVCFGILLGMLFLLFVNFKH